MQEESHEIKLKFENKIRDDFKFYSCLMVWFIFTVIVMPRAPYQDDSFCEYNIPNRIESYYGSTLVLPYMIIIIQLIALKFQRKGM